MKKPNPNFSLKWGIISDGRVFVPILQLSASMFADLFMRGLRGHFVDIYTLSAQLKKLFHF